MRVFSYLDSWLIATVSLEYSKGSDPKFKVMLFDKHHNAFKNSSHKNAVVNGKKIMYLTSKPKRWSETKNLKTLIIDNFFS